MEVFDEILEKITQKNEACNSEENDAAYINNDKEIEDGNESKETRGNYDEEESMDLEEIADLVQHQEEELKNKEEKINQLQKEIRVLLSKANDKKLKEAEDLKEDMERVCYQNIIMIGWLEQVEENEAEYVKRIKELELIVQKYEEDEIIQFK